MLAQPAPPPESSPAPEGGASPASPDHETLLREVQRRERRLLAIRGGVLGAAGASLLVLVASWLGTSSPATARVLLLLAPIAIAIGVVAFGVVLALRWVGDELRTARRIRRKDPELSRALLSAVELKRAAVAGEQFSLALARAHVAAVDERARAVSASRLVGVESLRVPALVLTVTLLGCALVAALTWPRAKQGLRAALTAPQGKRPEVLREPITGDLQLTYRYPAHTGLSPRTVDGAAGDVSAPAGSEVKLKTRADRVVQRAAAIVNGVKVPLVVAGGRDLSGSFVVDKAGSYHFAFFSSSGRELVRGPDFPLTVESDQPPSVRIHTPAELLEIDPGQSVTLKYEASDDYGLSSLELVYRGPGEQEDRRVNLSLADGRRHRDSFVWDLAQAGLRLRPGQRVTYFIEATDNDAVRGAKRGSSRTQVLKVYSAAEHRREAVRRAEALWDRLILHMADRMEGPDREKKKEPSAVDAASRIDDSGAQLTQDMLSSARELSRERDAPKELTAALANIGESFTRDVTQTASARRLYLRLVQGGAEFDVGQRLTQAAASEISEAEKHVLYLESLIDRQKLKDIKELAQQLEHQRRELASLIEEYRKTQDQALRDSILQQVAGLREQIAELMRRMAELAKGIRDEHINQEALRDMMQERDLNGALDEVERLMREGNADQALAKLQELAMQMDEMTRQLGRAEDEAGAERYPELASKFKKLMEALAATADEQRAVATETKELKDRYREQVRERLAQRGQTLREELLKQLEQLGKSYRALQPGQLPSRADRLLDEVNGQLENLEGALKAGDFDLSAEEASRAARSAQQLSEYGEHQRQLDEIYQNPPQIIEGSKALAERLRRDAAKLDEIDRKLQQLFPPPGSTLSEQDRERTKGLAQRQAALERRAAGLEQQMQEISDMAPVFGEDAKSQLEQVGERMGEAKQRMEARDPARGYGEQRAALEQLEQLQKQIRESRGSGSGGGLPLPMMAGRGSGWDSESRERVEIPDEDDSQASKEFRKDLLDAMKQGAPDRYRDQVKRYYEELVK